MKFHFKHLYYIPYLSKNQDCIGNKLHFHIKILKPLKLNLERKLNLEY